jgi:hypothetical protein
MLSKRMLPAQRYMSTVCIATKLSTFVSRKLPKLDLAGVSGRQIPFTTALVHKTSGPQIIACSST